MKNFGYLMIGACLLANSTICFASDDMSIYGYFATRLEKVFSEPSIAPDGTTETADAPAEWAIPYVNIMMQYQINDDFRTYVNITGEDASILSIQNIYGEYRASDAFMIRAGKIYRKFGLYNEILDAVPTYYGIEPPELFDGDHLLVSRTTNLMVMGNVPLGDGMFRYAVSTDNGEGGPVEGGIPVGFDLRYTFLDDALMLGTSGYLSNGTALSDVGVGEGSPNNGVLPWMSADTLTIFGGFAELTLDALTVQGEFWTAQHNAMRDPAAMVNIIQNAGINARQRENFMLDPEGEVAVSNIDPVANFDIVTYYVRVGYSLQSDIGEIAPYVQYDYYENPETIQSKSFGGDNEAGLADDGKFTKLTAGVVYRPVFHVAIKLDGSTHIQEYNGESISYPEIRLDASYLFGI